MSGLKKAIHGERYRNIGNERMIKSLEKKIVKLKGEYLLRYSDFTAEKLEGVIDTEVRKRREIPMQRCKDAKYKKEIKIRKKQDEIKTNESKVSKLGFQRNYKVAQAQSLEQHLRILELQQQMNILKGMLL